MKVNNFKELKQFFKSHVLIKEHDFLFAQIIKRRKDNENIGRDNQVIKDYFFTSIDDIINKEKDIINICEATNSRFYVNLNKRNKKDVTIQCLLELSQKIKNESYNNTHSLFTTACGKCCAEKNKKWIVDLDDSYADMVGRMSHVINALEPKDNTMKVIYSFKTVNGVHLICTPFRLDKFSLMFPEIDVHKDNPTLVYF